MIIEGHVLETVLVIAAAAGALIAARMAFRVHVDLPRGQRPQHPVLFYNPRSGGGKAARFHVAGLGADDTGAADGTRSQMREMPIVGEAVLRRILAHRRHHDAIARLHRAQLKRAKQVRL